MADVTVIPATRSIHTKAPADVHIRRKVTGYAHVSTDSEEQLTSYEAQVDYYTNFIRSNPDREFVGAYTDDGISGTTFDRSGFREMEDLLKMVIFLPSLLKTYHGSEEIICKWVIY